MIVRSGTPRMSAAFHSRRSGSPPGRAARALSRSRSARYAPVRLAPVARLQHVRFSGRLTPSVADRPLADIDVLTRLRPLAGLFSCPVHGPLCGLTGYQQGSRPGPAWRRAPAARGVATTARKEALALRLGEHGRGHRLRRRRELRGDQVTAGGEEVDRPGPRRDAGTACASPRSSEMMTPPKPHWLAQQLHHDGREHREAGRRRSGCRWRARPSRTARPARDRRRGTTPGRGRPAVVTLSTTSAVKSVLPVTRPRPGKCLAAVATPASAIPRDEGRAVRRRCSPGRSRTPCRARRSARWTPPSPAGTTSMTGARSRLTPAARSSLPQPAADCAACSAGQLPWVSADGMVANPGPVSCWICPPSWLAAMKNRTPPVSAGAPAPA